MRSNNRQGSLRKNLSGDIEYESFVPAPLQQIKDLQLPSRTIRLLGECSRQIGYLNGFFSNVEHPEALMSLLIRKEALLSAQIEGNCCTFDDIFGRNADGAIGSDVSEVFVHEIAINYAVERMKTLPICVRLLREAHAILLDVPNSKGKTPGLVRTTQNWIGPAGCALKNAPYVPPNPRDMVSSLFDLESFINEENEIDPLVKAALVHYQFETIHPFLDGNGRIGRLLIILSLMNDEVIDMVTFCPSCQLKLRRSEYYAHLTKVREEGSFEEWVNFFLQCLLDSVNKSIKALDSFRDLQSENTALKYPAILRESCDPI